MENCAVVIGGYVNGYSIISELYNCKVSNIILLSSKGELSNFSNKLKEKIIISSGVDSLHNTLLDLSTKYKRLILFPTSDIHLEYLVEIYEDIRSFCYVPVNVENFSSVIKKSIQYDFCDRLDVPFPKTINIKNLNEIKEVEDLMFPIIVKPDTREDLESDVFRNIIFETKDDFDKYKSTLIDFLKKGITFLISEVIPGDTNENIFAYVCCRTTNGNIHGEWVGNKLTQYPNNFGMFSSASNQAPKEIIEQGRKLVEGMNLFGIVEPEFKYDYRDGKYKLMEINLRSMMWHRVGFLDGVNLHYQQYLYGVGDSVPIYNQHRQKRIHMYYTKHEIFNLIYRKGYLKFFINNRFKGDFNTSVLYDKKDPKVFIYDFIVSLLLIFKSLFKYKKNVKKFYL